MPSNRTYTLDKGVQQTLEAVLPRLESQINGWQDQLASGEIDEQFRGLAIALGWITQRDSRVHPKSTPASPRRLTGNKPYGGIGKNATGDDVSAESATGDPVAADSTTV